jgi:2'-5' RNA ligase
VTPTATVGGGDRLRLFVGLRLPATAADGIAAWQAAHLTGRLVPRDHLHVTVAFLGARPAGVVDAVSAAVSAAAAVCRPAELLVRGYRETRSVGMLVCEDVGGLATTFAVDVQTRLEQLGVYRREGRPWLAHVTVLRFRERPGLRPPTPDLGPVVPSEAAVYLSVLRPSGAQYDVLNSVALGR